MRTRASPSDRSERAGPRRMAAPTAIDALLGAHVADLRLAGLAVVVVDRKGVRFQGAYGRARRGGAAMTLDTPVVLGSTGKQFTGLAIHALVRNEQLRLDDTVGELLSRLGGADGALADVTVEQLLAHRSGLSRASGLDVFRLRPAARSIRDQARRLLREEPIASPGERFAYSNANYILLGAIIEAVTGATYAAALQQLVAEPLELAATTADLRRARREGLAEAEYTWFRLVNARTPGTAPEATAPAGYVASTARDLSKLLRAHLGAPSGLDPAVLAAARAPLGGAVPPAEYASGWVVRPLPEATGLIGAPDGRSPTLWEHEGDSLRTMSYLAIVPELDVGVAMLTNTALGTDGRRFTALSTGLLHAVLGGRAALRRERQKTSGLGVEAWRIDTSAWRSKR